MKLKIKHLRHPLRTARAARALVVARRDMRRCADRGERQFRGDARYDLASITRGFASVIDNSDDTALMERICAAYARAVEGESLVPQPYRATEWWEHVRRENLKHVIQALLTRDAKALRSMYRNFFRDPCSAGLIGLPWSGALFGDASSELYRRFYLSDVLHRIGYWKVKTEGRFQLSDLAGPGAGNPFGALIEGNLIRAGSEYHHYCAHHVIDLLDSRREAAVIEIGGGFGDMAYYLLRDRPRVTYINFDLPETIALASYYLLKVFPERRFLLYGEDDFTTTAIAAADVVLMPAVELARMPAATADLIFCSHLLSDIASDAMAEYLGQVGRIAPDFFLFVGSNRAGKSISRWFNRNDKAFELAEVRDSAWLAHRTSNWDEVECLYSPMGAAVHSHNEEPVAR